MTDFPPPPEDPSDARHLALLRTFHFVWAGLSAFFGCVLGAGMLALATVLVDQIEAQEAAQRQAEIAGGAPPSAAAGPPAGLFDMMRWMYGGMGAAYLVGGLLLAILALVTANALATRRRRTFCFVASAIQCLAMPLGTALGVFTILVLSRESVARRFEDGRDGR